MAARTHRHIARGPHTPRKHGPRGVQKIKRFTSNGHITDIRVSLLMQGLNMNRWKHCVAPGPLSARKEHSKIQQIVSKTFFNNQLFNHVLHYFHRIRLFSHFLTYFLQVSSRQHVLTKFCIELHRFLQSHSKEFSKEFEHVNSFHFFKNVPFLHFLHSSHSYDDTNKKESFKTFAISNYYPI